LVAQVGFEPTASLGLSKGGRPVAYRAGSLANEKGQASGNAWPAKSCTRNRALRGQMTIVSQPRQTHLGERCICIQESNWTTHEFISIGRRDAGRQ